MHVFTKSLGFILIATLTWSCQKKTAFNQANWEYGQSPETLKTINEIQTTNEVSQITYEGQRVEFRKQIFNDQAIENSYVKKVYAADSKKIASASAFFTNTSELNKKKLKPVHADTILLIEKVAALSAPLLVRRYEVKNLLKLDNGILKNFRVVQYELSDATIWRAYFTGFRKFIKNERLGSRFTETEARVYIKGPKQGPLTDISIKNLVTSPTFSNDHVYVDTESPQKIDHILPELKFDPKDERFDQIQVFYYLDYIQNWMKNTLSVSFPQKLEAVVQVGYPDKTNTAFYFNNKIRLGHGDDVDYSMLSSDPSIVYHESFHALIDGLARLPFEGEGGSINEGFADFFTCVVLNRPFLGESAYLKASYKRTIESEIKLQDKTGGLYHDSQIVSSLLWNIKEKLGSEKALKIATDTLVRLNPYSEFKDFNEQLNVVLKKNLSTDEQKTIAATLNTQGFTYE